jgi:hypothetical protein
MFDPGEMVELGAVLTDSPVLADNSVLADMVAQASTLTRPTAPRLPVAPALATVLPNGLRRGSTVAVSGSVSLLLALIAAASQAGAWCAMVAMPAISAEAAHDVGVELFRLPLVPDPGPRWVEVVGALLDAMDVVVARAPAQLANGDIRRLAARARSRGVVFMPFLAADARWPGADVRLSAADGVWSGIGSGYGRLRRRRLTVSAEGRGTAAGRRHASLWLPTANGGVEPYDDAPSALPRLSPALTLLPSTRRRNINGGDDLC